MRNVIAAIVLAGAAFGAQAVEAQSYFMRQHLVGLNTSGFAGKWESQTSDSGACYSNGTAMVKNTTTTASCTGGTCDPAKKPATGAGTTACRPVCDGSVQAKTNGRVATANGKSTQEVALATFEGPGWDSSKAYTCQEMAKTLNKRLFGCTQSRISGATNAWMGDFSIPAGATEANANLNYVACSYK
jgi:hypothetical protein